jgi:hypothetical protein
VAAVPIRDDAPALAVVLMTAANARPTRRAQAIAQLCRERLTASPPGGVIGKTEARPGISRVDG